MKIVLEMAANRRRVVKMVNQMLRLFYHNLNKTQTLLSHWPDWAVSYALPPEVITRFNATQL